MKKEKGVTLTSLVIVIVILLILAAITINAGIGLIEKAELQTVVTDMLLIKAKTKIAGEEATYLNDDSKLAGITDDGVINNLKGKGAITEEQDTSKCRVFRSAELNSLGLTDIKVNSKIYYVVDYATEEVYYVPGIKIEGIVQYKLSEIQELNME